MVCFSDTQCRELGTWNAAFVHSSESATRGRNRRARHTPPAHPTLRRCPRGRTGHVFSRPRLVRLSVPLRKCARRVPDCPCARGDPVCWGLWGGWSAGVEMRVASEKLKLEGVGGWRDAAGAAAVAEGIAEARVRDGLTAPSLCGVSARAGPARDLHPFAIHGDGRVLAMRLGRFERNSRGPLVLPQPLQRVAHPKATQEEVPRGDRWNGDGGDPPEEQLWYPPPPCASTALSQHDGPVL